VIGLDYLVSTYTLYIYLYIFNICLILILHWYKWSNISKYIIYIIIYDKKDIIVFDVDGTLAESSLEIQDENAIILNQLKEDMK